MTDKERIIAEIERLYKEWEHGTSAEAKYRREAYKELLETINSACALCGNNIWKDANGDDLPEYEREVIVLLDKWNGVDLAQYMRVGFAHRPDPQGWDGKSLTTGKVEHFDVQTYDKGGWNGPGVKYWLDVELPKTNK